MSKKAELPEKLKLQVLFENKLAAIFITKPDGTILDVNRTAEKMFGYSVKEFRKIGRGGVIDPNSPGLSDKLKEREATGSASGELIAIRKGGEKFTCDFSSSIYVDETGERYAAVFLIDSTDRKRVEFQSKIFLDHTEEAFILLDRELNIVTYNDQFQRLYKNYFGIDVVQGNNIIQYAQPERREIVMGIYQKVLQGSEEQSKIIIPLPDKSEKVFSIRYKPVKESDGGIKGVFVSAVEITESFKVEQSNERFEYVTKATSDAIWDYELKTGNLFWGEGYKTLFGYENYDQKKEYSDWSDKVHPDDIERVENQINRFIEGNNLNFQQEYRFQKADGSFAIVMDRAVILRDDHGKAERLIGAIQDITEQKLRSLNESVISGIHRAFTNSTTISEALDQTIGTIQNARLFTLTEIWMVDNNKELIELTASIHSTSEQQRFYKATEAYQSFKKGEGLPGEVWQKKSELFWLNIDKRTSFIRREAAGILKLKTAIGFPIMVNQEVLGVVVLGVNHHVKKEGYYSAITSDLSVVLGLEISRKRLENDLKMIFDSAPDIICMAGLDGYFKRVNPAMSELLGYSEEEILDRPIVDFTHPNDRAKTEEELIKLNRKNGSQTFENRFIAKSGKVVWLSWTTRPLYDQGYVFSMARDVTDQKEIEEHLRHANRLAKIGSWNYNIQNEEIYWSEITRQIHEAEPGYNPQLSEAMNFYKEGESRDRILDAVQEAAVNGTPWDLELQIVTAKGNEKWVRTIGEVEMHNDKPIRMYGSFQDIDEQKKAAVEFKKLSEQRIEILERIGDGFFAVDNDFTVTYWNQRAADLLQMPKELILGNHLWDLFSDAKENISYQKYNQALNEQKMVQFEDYYDKIKRWFEVSAYPSQNGLSVYFKDITQRKASEELLKELNQSLEQKAKELSSSNAELENFAFVASHDLQEPLRMITSFLAQLENKYDHVLDEKGKKYIHFASDGAKRMRQIILDLLEYSRVGRLNIERSYADLNEIVEDIKLLYKRVIMEKKAVIKSQNLPKIWGVKSLLQQILQNLVHNSLNYSKDDVNPEIVITAEETENYWKVSVRDNGIGIHPEHHEKIFNLFQRLHNNETYNGTGLGLAISKKIVEDHGGQIWLESEEGKGSVFHFTIEKLKK